MPPSTEVVRTVQSTAPSAAGQCARHGRADLRRQVARAARGARGHPGLRELLRHRPLQHLLRDGARLGVHVVGDGPAVDRRDRRDRVDRLAVDGERAPHRSADLGRQVGAAQVVGPHALALELRAQRRDEPGVVELGRPQPADGDDDEQRGAGDADPAQRSTEPGRHRFAQSSSERARPAPRHRRACRSSLPLVGRAPSAPALRRTVARGGTVHRCEPDQRFSATARAEERARGGVHARRRRARTRCCAATSA